MRRLRATLEKVLISFCKENPSTKQYAVSTGLTQLGRVFGCIVWDGFSDMEVTQRQKIVWDYIRKRIPSPEQRKLITAIYARSPQEAVEAEELRAQEDSCFFLD